MAHVQSHAFAAPASPSNSVLAALCPARGVMPPLENLSSASKKVSSPTSSTPAQHAWQARRGRLVAARSDGAHRAEPSTARSAARLPVRLPAPGLPAPVARPPNPPRSACGVRPACVAAGQEAVAVAALPHQQVFNLQGAQRRVHCIVAGGQGQAVNERAGGRGFGSKGGVQRGQD